MLAGIVVNNAIVLIDAINQRRGAEAGQACEPLTRRGPAARLRPILMTTATTVLGLACPWRWVMGEGAELRGPTGHHRHRRSRRDGDVP